MKTIRVLLVDVDHDEVKDMEIKDSLDTFYALIRCSMVEMPMRKIGGKYFNVICDEEGLFVPEPKISALSDELDPMLVGNLIVTKVDDEGNLASLSDEEIEHLMKCTITLPTKKYPQPYTMLYPVDY